MSENCGVIVIFLIHGQFGAIWLPFILQKLKAELKNIWHSSHTIILLLYKGTIFDIKSWFFAKNTDISKTKKVLVSKDTISETRYMFVLMYKISNY